MGLAGAWTVCDVIKSNVIGGDVSGIRSRTISDGSHPVGGAAASRPESGSLHGCHGLVASAECPGCSWTPAVVFMQCVHDVLRLFSGPAEVIISPGRGGGGGEWMVWTLSYVHILLPAQTTVCIQVMSLALFVLVCFDVARLPLVLVVGPVLGGPGV